MPLDRQSMARLVSGNSRLLDVATGDAKADPFRLPLGDLFLQLSSCQFILLFGNEDSVPGGPQCQFDVLARSCQWLDFQEMKLAVAGMIPNTELSLLSRQWQRVFKS